MRHAKKWAILDDFPVNMRFQLRTSTGANGAITLVVLLPRMVGAGNPSWFSNTGHQSPEGQKLYMQSTVMVRSSVFFIQ